MLLTVLLLAATALPFVGLPLSMPPCGIIPAKCAGNPVKRHHAKEL